MGKADHRVLHNLRVCRKQGKRDSACRNEQKIHGSCPDHGEEHAQAEDSPASVIFSGRIVLAGESDCGLVEGIYNIKGYDLKIEGSR